MITALHQPPIAAADALESVRSPYSFQVSGLYFYGDNGKDTTTSGVDILGVGLSE